MKNIWINGMMGVVMGDVLGMPVQFVPREELKNAPITQVEGYGTYNMPPGTWSDDSSMAIATLDSIRDNKRIDYDDIMTRFVKWTLEGQYTPAGVAFDQGNTCVTLEEAVEYVHQVSALTHNHMRSKMACGIYFFIVQSILDKEGTLIERLQQGMDEAKKFYKSDMTNLVEWSRFGRMTNLSEFADVSEEEIKSSGYVVDSLEAAVWSLITTTSFEEGLLRAVNLGDDTDTIGAIAGGLAGLYYGYNNIPAEWRKVIIKREEIIALCEWVEEEFYVG